MKCCPHYFLSTVIFYFLFYGNLAAQQPKAFYIGHSLSDQIPDMVQSLSDDHPMANFSWVYQTIPGAPLRWNWERKDAQDYYPIEPHYYGFYDENHGIPTGNFDVLVLTESVPRYEAIIDETYAYADSFYRYATQYNPNIQVYLYEDWHCLLSDTPTGCDYDVDSNPWRQRLVDDLPMWESVIDSLNARYNPTNPVCLIPAAQGLAKLYDSIQVNAIPDINSIEDLFSDNIHLNDVGKYFVACIHFSTIHNLSPVGLTNQLQVWWGGDFNPPSQELALKFQEIAWEVANSYPNSCLNNNPTFQHEIDHNYTIYPNPAKDYIQINGLTGSRTVTILDTNGKIHYKIEVEEKNPTISISKLPKGIFIIRVQNNNRILSAFRFLKY